MPPTTDRFRQRRVEVEEPRVNEDDYWTKAAELVRVTEQEVETTKRQPRVVTSVSDVEKWLPKIHGVKERQMIDSSEAAVTGETLHLFHSACNLIAHDYAGVKVGLGLPTTKLVDVKLMQRITDGLYLRSGASVEEMENLFLTAWQRCFQLQQVTPAETLPMFEGMGFVDPRIEEVFRQSERLYLSGKSLAGVWARIVGGEVGIPLKGKNSATEVMVVVNTDNCQLRARLDTITKIIKPDKREEIFVFDLKTGRSEAKSWLEIEIQKRQSQLMLFAVEKLMGKYLRSKKWLEQTGQAYVLKAKEDKWSPQHRCHLVYLRFNQGTGELKMDEVQISRAEREEFGEWLRWYVAKIRELRPVR